ncbi:MAG: zinc-ribbon domain-containing protein [Promethearchaeota archaeon]
MIFNGDDKGMHHMMDWGLYMWFYMIIGLFAFLIIAIILIYLITRLSREHKDTTKSKQEFQQANFSEEDKGERPSFCPTCGEKLDNSKAKYCPSCGSEI